MFNFPFICYRLQCTVIYMKSKLLIFLDFRTEETFPKDRIIWTNLNLHYCDNVRGSFHVNLSFSGLVVLEKKIFQWLTLFLHFCDYLPLKRTWSFMKKLEFPFYKDNLYKVWLKFACWFWRTGFLKIFKNINTSKNGFPFCGPWPKPILSLPATV
jgi:hypothetical protein